LAISSRFRRQVKHFLVKQYWRLLKLHRWARMKHPNGVQVVPETVVQGPISIVESANEMKKMSFKKIKMNFLNSWIT
jgi:hypothetical protein